MSQKINFCTIPETELMKIFEFCGVSETAQKSDISQTMLNGVLIEKKYEHYDTITVTPDRIYFALDPYPRREIMNIEKYEQLKAF